MLDKLKLYLFIIGLRKSVYYIAMINCPERKILNILLKVCYIQIFTSISFRLALFFSFKFKIFVVAFFKFRSFNFSDWN